jgi:hypothetical protein
MLASSLPQSPNKRYLSFLGSLYRLSRQERCAVLSGLYQAICGAVGAVLEQLKRMVAALKRSLA